MGWLDDLIECACPTPPALVGQILGGAIAARFASDHSERLSRLVLVDALGLADFQPSPEFGRALGEFISAPAEDMFTTGQGLWDWLVSSNPIAETLLDSLNLTNDETGVIKQTLETMVRDRAGSDGAATLTSPINIGIGVK